MNDKYGRLQQCRVLAVWHGATAVTGKKLRNPQTLLLPFSAHHLPPETLDLPRPMDPQQPEPVSYLCGDCGAENTLKPGDVIQCRECGYRILYKKRTRRIVQYEAR
ncbi:hypothetical protein GQ55_7G321600 [Panicum hallii var. hallii]|uniref:Uncharacterized protein n=1 Tax=Panicum hallii var. hallii TaxID=1504633 RepID=A0A2T7D1J4_9POAL|nr:hypothetical protein GQ55_7G321600 [Panicum hallii var. hallii]